MKDYDAFLFDWDGTLARTLELWLEEIYKQHGVYGIEITRSQIARDFGNLKAPLQYGLPHEKLSEFQEGVNDAVRVLLPDVALYDDAADMLRHLKAEGKKLGLITTSLRPNLDTVMRKHEVEDLFDLIVTSEDVKTHKPDPEGINFAIAHLDVDKTKTVMLGDSDKDLQAAKNAGIDSILFYPEAHEVLLDLNDLLMHEPKHTLKAWRELIDQLQ